MRCVGKLLQLVAWVERQAVIHKPSRSFSMRWPEPIFRFQFMASLYIPELISTLRCTEHCSTDVAIFGRSFSQVSSKGASGMLVHVSRTLSVSIGMFACQVTRLAEQSLQGVKMPVSCCSFVLPVIIGVVVAAVSAVFEWNRYRGLCGSFNDSTGGYRDGKYLCWLKAVKSKGNEDGPMGIDRSGSLWIFVSVLYVSVTIVNLLTLLYRIMGRRQVEKGSGQISGTLGISADRLDSHVVELYRVCWLLYLFTAAAFLFECIEVAKTFLCKRRPGEMFNNLVAGVSFLAQGISSVLA